MTNSKVTNKISLRQTAKKSNKKTKKMNNNMEKKRNRQEKEGNLLTVNKHRNMLGALKP